ncbi:RmlC-like cupin [Neurospora crassa]|uniref:Pirin n=2 Tax=Neurospora crassa TaxID=5141 RepID=Q7RX22_NEUCR|nr:pirin [Neurospora crassa OR74A]EAA27068.2 pirin [Neurospora crassa OR74A]KHE79142.1 RmlC-like cupin [Neurospora crassa]CAD70316.1 related to pirin [Neurospora crassa]|eukprot:XP_956304.2 pirin [Neurospora crassa OR74A]
MKNFFLVTIISILVGICSIFLLPIDLLQVDISTLTNQLLNYTNINTYFATQPSEDISASSTSSSNPTIVITTTPTAANMSVPRLIRKIFLATEQAEGAGARVRRSIGTPQLRNFSPFLMLDHFTIRPGSGFPDHPHRGQETITYLLSGGVDHEDFAGNKGTIEAGDLQFMTAGRGIMHAEMPRQNPDGSANVGLQLWVDLPKELKSCEPRYRDLKAQEIPTVETDEGRVKIKVISGKSHGVDSVKDLAYTPVWILDVEVKPGGKVVQEVPEGWNAFAYTLEGTAIFSSGKDGEKRTVEQFHNVVFEPQGEAVYAEVDAGAEKPARFVLVAGTPLDQKVVQYGPFVLNSQEEVYQAFVDYQTHSNGFERAQGWRSEIGKSMRH